MSEHANKLVFLEPTEVQKLRLALAQRNCDLNIAHRWHMESEIRFYRFTLSVAQANFRQRVGSMDINNSLITISAHFRIFR